MNPSDCFPGALFGHSHLPLRRLSHFLEQHSTSDEQGDVGPLQSKIHTRTHYRFFTTEHYYSINVKLGIIIWPPFATPLQNLPEPLTVMALIKMPATKKITFMVK